MILAKQLSTLRRERNLSLKALGELTGLDPRVVGGLERGEGTLSSLETVAGALNHYVSPYPSALANKRRWLGIGTRTLADDAGITRPTLRSLEATSQGRVASYEAVCAALDEQPRLSAITPTWWTPKDIVDGCMSALQIATFDIDPCSPTPPVVNCKRHFSERDGGLWFAWTGDVWFAPPYDAVPLWIDKAIAEFNSGRVSRIIGVLPFRPETKHWQVLLDSGCDLIVLDGRPKWGGRNYSLPSATVIVSWGLTPTELRRLHTALPPNRIMYLERSLADVA